MPALDGSMPPQLDRSAPELSIVVPTFNERENIPRLIDTLRAALPDIAWELIIVDDDSPDGTSETAKRLAAADSRIRCIRRVGRRGLAGACLEGILSSQAQYVAVMDGDLQHDEALLKPMLQLLRRDTANMVVATRYADGGSAAALSSHRARGSRLATRLAHHLLKLELRLVSDRLVRWRLPRGRRRLTRGCRPAPAPRQTPNRKTEQLEGERREQITT